jgi:hypothetical protein
LNEGKAEMTASFERKSFSVQMRNFFGFRPGDGGKEFGTELKTLSYEDKLAFAEMLNDAGFPCDQPSAAPTGA